MKADILNFIQSELSQDAETDLINFDSELLLEGIVDSLGVMRLADFIEENCGIEVKAEHITIENFASINVIADYVSRVRSQG